MSGCSFSELKLLRLGQDELTRAINKLSWQNLLGLQDSQKKSALFARAKDNIRYEFDYDGDGEPDDTASYNYEINKIEEEEKTYQAQLACEENERSMLIAEKESELDFMKNSEECFEKIQEDSNKTLGIFGSISG